MPQKIEERLYLKNQKMARKIRTSGRFHDDDVSKFAVTISASPELVFNYFRDFSNLPSFMMGLKEVKVLSPTRSRWVVELKNGLKAEWEADITAERPGEMIAWKSIDGSEVETKGSIWFSPTPVDQGTVVGLILDYKVPGGKLTELLTMLTLESPDLLAAINLKRLKAIIETGEIATVEGQSSGRDEDAETVVTH